MILRELYQSWSDRSKLERQSQYPGPFLLVNWPVEPSPWNRLVIPVVDGKDPSKREHLIGRVSKCDIQIREAGISSRHALLQRTADNDSAWMLVDLCSTNGTYTRRTRVVPGEPERLENGQSFILGTEVQVEYYSFDGLHALFENEDSGEAPSGTLSDVPLGDETQTFERNQLKNMLPNPGMVSNPKQKVAVKPWNPQGESKGTTNLRFNSSDDQDSGGPYVLNVEGHDPVEFSAGKPLVIGRAPSSEMRLNHPQVSRRHVRVTVEGGNVFVEDLGSSNGTIVGTYDITGRKVPLDASRAFWIGPFCLKVESKQEADDSEKRDPNFTTQLRLKLDKKEATGITMSGSISPEQTVAELFQGIEFNEKSGTLFIEGSKIQGLVCFKNGRPLNAQSHGECGVQAGESALYSLLAVSDGKFSFGREVDDSEATLHITVTGALVEFSRQQDEEGR